MQANLIVKLSIHVLGIVEISDYIFTLILKIQIIWRSGEIFFFNEFIAVITKLDLSRKNC